MMKRIMTSGVAAVALAASAAFALPAAADAPAARATVATKIGSNTSLVIQVGDSRARDSRYGYRSRYRLNQWGQTPQQVQRLSREAVQACRREIERLDSGRRSSFRDVDVESRGQARQIGRQGFDVFFRNVEFEGRHRGTTRPVSCEVRQGRVVDIDGIPMERWNKRVPDRRAAPAPKRR